MSGLFALLDDVAALAKLAAASIDDVGAAAGKASVKAAGVVIDDTAVTPAYVQGLAANRELPIIRKIAIGSLKNKLLFILPAALVLSQFVPVLVDIILMFGGAYLCFEGAEKIHHRFAKHDEHHETVAEVFGPEHEAKTISSAIRTDFILSAEIMVISLKTVLDKGIVSRTAILAVVAVAITAVVYGVVAIIVKMDDVGLRLTQTGSAGAQKFGRGLVAGMPKLLAALSVVGTAAMLWVGGHILLVGAKDLHWKTPYKFVEKLEKPAHDVAGIGGALGWMVNTFCSAVVGIVVGFAIVTVLSKLPFGKGKKHATEAASASH
jgi:uncharacterized protein